MVINTAIAWLLREEPAERTENTAWLCPEPGAAWLSAHTSATHTSATHTIFSSFNRKLFFTDCGSAARVERCDMDGMNRTWIVRSRLEQPTALALDLVNKYVYWLDIYLESVEVVDYQGRKRHAVIEGRQVFACK